MASKKGKDYEVRPLSWVFYMIILPIIFTVVLLIVILQFILGFNVTGTFNGWIEQFPVVRHALGIPPKPIPVSTQVATLRLELATKSAQDQAAIGKLKTNVAKLQGRLTADSQRLTTVSGQLRSAQSQLAAAKRLSFDAASEASVFTNMSSDQAALILADLPFQEQVLTLHAMNAGDAASILSRLSPKLAAKLLQAGG